MITILLLVSRTDYLHRVFASLEALECDSSNITLLTIVDGNEAFVEARNRTMESKFKERLCIQYLEGKKSNYNMALRRKRIAEINNFAKDYIKTKWLFGIEDDTVFPSHTLRSLESDYLDHPFAGFIEAVEVGRWNIPHIGAWKVDDIYNPTSFKTLLPSKEMLVEPIDAGGLYCYLTKSENFVDYDFLEYKEYGLGPDVGFGIDLRRKGLTNYIDWSVNCIHVTKSRDIIVNNDVQVLTYNKTEKGWRNESS